MGDAALSYSIHRFEALAPLSVDERATLQSLGDPEIRRARGETFQREGEALTGFHLHIRGWIASSVLLRTGNRLIQKVHLPGDMLGTPSMVLPTAADTLTAITDAATAFVPYERFARLYETAPRLAALFTVAVQMERLALMDALAVTGRASAREQFARLLIDLHARLSPINAVEGDAFDLPLTQEAIGDLLGLTPVHVNRTIRAFESEGLIARNGHRMRLLDLPALRALCPLQPRRPRYDPAWLPPSR
ncbi:Crp/Fnr family transcriptional regulator [Sphingomonas spermidinifaciens]|uniref:Crp/Fnr family transcriptional regulator n=1 Tax=Sphingomonas spermidinifaciens TaxID=1141889 RepID=A0A2A4B8L8_9SPHN|nr:Crp/Fnr family transcriptional regulator [Sphingomonas spermidinifaciens]PCD04427.1 Crp/Fnr family transcriptional regulator [Sphingomonas spermidinifaciens]